MNLAETMPLLSENFGRLHLSQISSALRRQSNWRSRIFRTDYSRGRPIFKPSTLASLNLQFKSSRTLRFIDDRRSSGEASCDGLREA